MASYALVGDHLMLAAPLSVSLAFAVMQFTDTMHPARAEQPPTASTGQHITVTVGGSVPIDACWSRRDPAVPSPDADQ